MNIKTIAKLAGVSVSTVSKIINNYPDISENTRKRVLALMQEHDYIPLNTAKTLATKKSGLIGVVFAGKLNIDFTHPFFVEVLNAFKKQMGLLGYDLLFFSNEKFLSADGDYPARCRHFQVDGCIVISGEELEPSIRELDESDIPSIGVDLKLGGARSGYIMSDNVKMSAKVVEHFYLLGYRKLGYIGSTMQSQISNLRETGYREALTGFGLAVRPEWFVHGATFYEEDGYRAMHDLLAAGPPPRAVWAASDLLAIGALRALKERGLSAPQDVAIIGCDDIEACRYLTPALSTVRQNKDKIGRLAAMMLYDLINKQSAIPAYLVEPELVIRASCGGKA